MTTTMTTDAPDAITFGPDPVFPQQVIYATSCHGCGDYLRIQGANAHWPDGTPIPAPTPSFRYCVACGNARLLGRVKR